jgi:hypothetical protein
VPGEPDSPSAQPRLRIVLAGLVAVALVVGLWAAFTRGTTPSTTTITTGPASTTSTGAPSTTVEPVTTASTLPSVSSTSLTAPAQTDYDVIVVGDGMGGATAATVAARLGADTLLLSPIGYFGGQAGAAGVSTMDEGGNRYVLRRSGIYKELVQYVQFRYGSGNAGECYFIEDPLCPEPLLVDEFFRYVLGTDGVDIAPSGAITDIIQEGNTVTGVIAGGTEYHAQVVIDATEFSDLYPLVEGLEYEVGDPSGCVQDTTWLAIRSWYQGGTPAAFVPPQDAMQQLYDLYGTESDRWLDHFRNKVAGSGSRPEGSGPGILPWDVATETAYRALADSRRIELELFPETPDITRTGVNYANDSVLSSGAIEDLTTREQEFRKALHITYAYLWYLRWELGVTDWGVSNDMQFSRGSRLLWDDLIPDDIEANLPPYPYVREGRRLIGVYNLGPSDLADSVRERHRFDDAVMLGGYFSDFHGCIAADGSGYGLFEVPMDVFIPETIDGFLPGIARAAGVSRVGAAALRTQPEEMWGGQVVGTIAGLAAINDIQPRQVSVDQVQDRLFETGLVFFLPSG